MLKATSFLFKEINENEEKTSILVSYFFLFKLKDIFKTNLDRGWLLLWTHPDGRVHFCTRQFDLAMGRGILHGRKLALYLVLWLVLPALPVQ